MLGPLLRTLLILALVVVGVPHALCVGHSSAEGMVDASAVPMCEHCAGRSGHPTSDSPSYPQKEKCPHCDLHSQPYAQSAAVKLADTAHLVTDWALLAVPLAGGVFEPATPAIFAESAPAGPAWGSGCALTIFLGRLLL